MDGYDEFEVRVVTEVIKRMEEYNQEVIRRICETMIKNLKDLRNSLNTQERVVNDPGLKLAIDLIRVGTEYVDGTEDD